MAWETPWVVGGASHSAEVLRLLSHAAFRGQYGVLGALDCRVLETAVPGPNIQVMPGAVNVPAKGVGNAYQSYTSALLSAETVGISPTDASGPRSDLLIARVEDPNVTGGGWTAPDPVTGPFMFTRVIPGVPATTNHVSQVRPNDSAITLARIDIPGGVGSATGTITNAMVKDLRSTVDAQRLVVPEDPAPPVATRLYADSKSSIANSVLSATQYTFIDWPSSGTWNVPVPSWATGVDIMCNINPHTLGHVFGEGRFVIDGVAGSPTTFDDNQGGSGGGGYRTMLNLSQTRPIDAAQRGKVINFKIQARQFSGFTLANLDTPAGTTIMFLLVFQQRPSFAG